MAFPSNIAPDPSDLFAFASIHLLLHNKHLLKERLFCSLGLHDILPLSSSPARRDRRRHRKHRSRKCNASKRALHFLKPGALAQIRDAARTAARLMPVSDFYASNKCDQVDMLHDFGRGERDVLQSHAAQHAAMSTSSMLPGAKVYGSTKILGPFCPQRKKLLAPKASLPLPVAVPVTPASTLLPTTDLDSLPLELLVRIVCNLRHDQLKPAFHVSKRFRQAVLIARQCHFDFMTPDRERQDESRLNTNGEKVKMAVSGARAAGSSRPSTPMAPRQPLHGRVPLVDMQQLAGPVRHGQENRLHRLKPPSLPHPANRVVASHRALFYEEQLCQAVSQNSI